MMFPGSSVDAHLTNQDRHENFFGEQRALNGQTDNPTLMQTGLYKKNIMHHIFKNIPSLYIYHTSIEHHNTRAITFIGIMLYDFQNMQQLE